MGPLSTFDPTYQDSAFIKSIKLKADGTFGKKAKVRTNEQFEVYKTVAEEKIIYAVQHIQQGDFKINPIRFRKKHSCTHCPFQDVCFRKDRDVEYKQLKKDLEDEPNTNS
jgi:ATP-dependent helicase/DNAse subunit B